MLASVGRCDRFLYTFLRWMIVGVFQRFDHHPLDHLVRYRLAKCIGHGGHQLFFLDCVHHGQSRVRWLEREERMRLDGVEHGTVEVIDHHGGQVATLR